MSPEYKIASKDENDQIDALANKILRCLTGIQVYICINAMARALAAECKLHDIDPTDLHELIKSLLASPEFEISPTAGSRESEN